MATRQAGKAQALVATLAKLRQHHISHRASMDLLAYNMGPCRNKHSMQA